MPEKKYYVNIPGTTEPTVLSENDFLAKKDKLYTNYPDANVVEMQDYNQNEEVGDTDFFINIPGSTEPTQMSAKDFAKKRDKLYATYPDVQVSRIRPINFRTTEAAAPSGYQQGVEAVTGGEEEFKMSREKQAALDAKKQRIDDIKAQLDNYNKTASEELAAIPGQQQRVIKESQQMPKRKELEKMLKEAEQSYYTDPNYLGQNKVASDQIDKADKELDELIAPIREESKERRSKSPIGAAGGYAMADMPSYDEMLYTAAKNLNKDSKRLYDAPSKYEPIGGAWYNHENKSNGFNQFMKGAGERASEADFWSMGLTGMVDQYALKDVFKKIQNELGGVGELTEANIDEKLTPMEKQLLAAFFRNADAQARRAEDLSNAYQAGRSAVDSAQFMAEFALSGGITGGIGKAALEVAPKSVKTFAKWISKTLAKETPASLTKGAVKLGTDLGKGAINMWFQPGTYKAILEAQNQFDENGDLVNQSKAAWNAILDRGIEVFSESTGDYIPGILGWGASKLGADKLIGKLANTELGKWGRAFYNSDALKTLKAGGWNGYFGEMSEEFIGAALRTATGIDPDAWKEQWDKDNLAVMALSFIPMSVIGGTVSTVKYGVARKNLADSQEQMPAILQNLGFNDEQIAHAMDVTQMTSPEKIRETIKPIVDEMASRGATKADQDALMNYAIAAATVNAYDGFESARVEQERDTARNELEQTYGEFWHGKEGEQTVERVTLPDGKSGYVQNTDETGLMTVKWDDGSTSFTSTKDGAQVESMPMNQYLDGIILSDKQAREAARMQEDAAVARQQFNTLLSQNTSVPMGTSEAQEEGKILTQQDPNTGAITPVRDEQGNYTVVTMNGQTKMSENELAAKWGLTLQPKTDQQIEEDEVAQYEASKKRVDAYNTIQPGTKVQAQLEGLEEPVEYEFTRAVYNEETGEVEIKVWDAENQREETLPESAFPDLSQAAAEMSQRTEVAEESAAENAQTPEDTTPRDYRGKPLPLKDDGSVNQSALWEDSPEAWAAWNDQQRQDGGGNSRAYIQAAVKTVEGEVAELQKAYASELDFDRRAAIEQQIAEKTRRAQELNSILNGYDARAKQAEEAAKAEKKAGKKRDEAIPAEQSQGELGPEYQVNGAQPAGAQPTPEQQAAAAEEQRRVPLRARALAWAEKIGVPVDLLETPDQVKDADAVEALKKGLRVAGWYNKASGKVRIYLPNIKDEAEIDKTFIHEVISHKGLADMLGAGYNTLLDHVWNDLMTEAERKKWTKYILDTNPNAKGETLQRAAADEYIADLSERIGLENVNTEELSKWEEFVKMIYNFFLQMMTGDLKVTQEDLSDLLVASMARYKEIKENGSAESLMRYAIAANNEEVRFSVRYAPKEGEIDQIASDISKQVGVSKEDATRWVESETSLAATIEQKENQPYLDYTADDRYTAIKQNSDYPQGTVDFNNICRKRLAFTDMYQRIQKAFPNVIITGEDLAKIRNIMKSHNLMVACGLCYVEDRRQLLGEIAKDFIDNYATNFEDYASRGGEAKKKNAEKFRKLIGEDRKDDLSIYDLITLSGAAQLREEHPGIYEAFQAFNNARGQQSGNLFQGYAEYKREILKWSKKKIKNVNDNGGLRIFSYSDFEAHHLIDVVQIILDCARMGVKIQGYTKVPAFARVVANTGVKLNRSLIPLGDTGMVDGKLAYDPVEGIDVNDPDFLESNDNIGNILIGINDEQIRLAMADPFVHYIIPYHSNQKEVLRSLKQTGAWTNYKNSQTEKDANGKATLINIYTDVIAAAEAEGKPIENERQFTEKFLEVCREKGLTPRFEQFLDRVGGQYVYTPGYYKLLLDFKMFDENGKYLPQQPVVAQFDDAFNTQILNDYVKDEKEKFGENLDDVYNEIVEALGLERRTPDIQQPKTGDQILGEILESIDRNAEKPGEDNGIRFAIRGFNGVLEAGDYEAEDNLTVAEEMEKAGKDPVTIWRATGWEKGADGRWRNEIPDAKQKEGTSLEEYNTAQDVVDAPELFKSYPDLQFTTIQLVDSDSAGAYNGKDNRIKMDRKYNTKQENGRTVLNKEGARTLVHEFQHAIQQIEGFAKGGSTKTMEYAHYLDVAKDDLPLATFAFNLSRRNSQARLIRAGREEVIRQAENLDKSRFNEKDKNAFAELIDRLKNITDKEYASMVRKAAKVVKDAEASGESGYKRLAGEVESRNVEERSRLSEEARRNNPPSTTEDVSRKQQIIRFRVANEDQRIFISNAEKAVSDLKMDKATPEQWKKTLEKNGGLKAAEDKWLGLSTWLDGLDRKTVTKQEVLDYISENQIQIEEQRYAEEAEESYARAISSYQKEYLQLVDEGEEAGEYNAFEYAYDQMIERYGDDFGMAFYRDGNTITPAYDYEDDLTDAARYFLNQRREETDVRGINATRLDYTTEGLRNRQEIALTVPTIESWNEGDKIHFGDAGEGRAIAWARFGDTWTSKAKDEAKKAYYDAFKAYTDYKKEITAKYALQATDTKKVKDLATEEENAKVRELYLESQKKYHDWQYGQHPREKVLVIDEIQSKRHQEAREQGGYKDDSALKKAQARLDAAKKAVEDYAADRYKQYGEENTLENTFGWTREEKEEYNRLYREYRDAQNIVTRNGFDPMQDEEYRRRREEQQAHEDSPEFRGLMDEWRRVVNEGGEDQQRKLEEVNAKLKPLQQRNQELLQKMHARENELAEEFNATHKSQIPAAPFEKNWHELTMKRMLRYAAENGYDTVAWTTGEQQADRYSLGGMVSKIEVSPVSDGTREVTIESSGADIYLDVDDQGVIVGQQDNYGENLRGKKLSDVVGKEMAVKIMGVTEEQTIEGDGLRVGGEGMKGFYDDILPRFMNKYGKKWGVKVEDINLPNLGADAEAGIAKGLTMHSVPVTEEMKESVMQGQTMFRVAMEEYDKESQELFDAAKERFGTTRDLREAGYVLPDGAMLDFSGRHMASGDTSYLNGSRTVDHRDIEDLNFERDLNTPSGRNTSMPDFIERGAIRIHYPGMINLAVKPTPEQASVLERLINADNSFVRVEFGNGYNSEHYADYDDARPARILNDINRYFDEGYTPRGNTMFRITPEQDAEYMEAVNADDMEKAQRMVDDAAEAAGYTIKAYHGTTSESGARPFNVIESGHFTDDRDFSVYYADQGALVDDVEPYVYRTYIKMENPLEYDFKGQNSDFAVDENGKRMTTYSVFNRAKEEGHDGVILYNVDEYGDGVEEEDGEYPVAITDYIPVSPNQVKSAEAVERDDQGNVIPLSERFNEGNNDIRFRVGSENINAGLNALEKLANGEEVVRDAMSRPDLSQYGADANVAFYWGETGDPNRNYKKGYGIAHMGAKHGPESIFRALDIIDHGDIERYVEGNKTVVLTDGEYEALLALTRSGRRETWLFNGWEKKENAGETSEVSTQSGSTQTNPTFSREDLGAAVSEYKDRINSENTNSSEEISISDEPMTATAPEVEESAIRFRKVEDPLKIAELEAGEKIPGYRTVVLNPDGSMASPMAGELGVAKAKKSEDRRVKTSSFTENAWNEAEENPDLADENGKIKLIKTDNAKRGLVDVDEVDYNPYNHLRLSPVNLQFKDAWKRPDLIYIKSEVPKSEAVDLRGIKDPAEKDRLSPYHAEKAVLPVGIHDWSGGGELLLSRWDKPVGQVAWEEIADAWANDEKVKEGVQFDRVPPQILDMLVERGIEILPPSKGKDKNEAYKAWKAGDTEAYEAWRDTGKAPKKTARVTRFRVAYHGSPADFSEFEEGHYREGVGSFHRPGFYFASDEKSARTYAYDRGNGAFMYEVELPDDNGSNYIHVFSSIPKSKRRELAVKIRQTFPEKDIDVEKRIVNKNILGEDLLGMFTNDELQQLGFVGIEGPMHLATMPQKQYVIFNAKDIKMKGKTNVATGEGIRFRTADDLVKRVQDYGLRGILDEDAAKAFWTDAFAVMPEDARKEIVDNAFSAEADKQDLNIRREVRKYIAALAKKGYAEDESGLLRYLADKIKAELGQDLDENTLRYLIWRSANRYASNNILDMAEDIAMRRRLGVGEFNGEKFPTGVSEATEEAENRIDEAENEREEERNEIRRTAPRTPFAALNRAMTAQRKYDQETVASIVALAKDMIKKGNIDNVSAREMARLMTIIKDANGRKPATVKAATLQLLDFMVDHTVGKEKELLDKMLKVRTAKVREPGVDTIAKLDLRAQNIINNFRDNYQLSEAEIDKLITELEDKMADGRRTDASLEDMRSQLEGLQLAKQYAAEIAALENDIKAIRQQMKDAKDEFDELSAEEKKKFRTALNEELAAGEEMIRAKKIQQVDAYRRLRGDIAKAIDEGAERAKTFLEAERERVEQIHHWANSDMQGVSADVRDRKLTGWAKFANSSFAKLFTAPLANLDQMLRTLGRKSPEGRGYLWNWMMGAVRKASDTEKLGIDAAEKKLNDKVSEIFDEPGMEWNDLYSMERKMPKAKMRYFSANGEWVEEELTQGNLLYIYMVNKMTDGRMKLRQMNITDENVEDIKKALDPRFVELADWIQEEFLPGLRDRYNETHKRLFGTSMASIENYFPLRILGGVIEEKRNVGDQEQKTLPTDITGAIIKRTVNAKQLNLAGTDAFSLVVEHVREMEHWNAYAEASRDFSTLLKYKRFQNQLKQLNTIYGAGKDLMNLFWDTVNLSVGAFRPTTTPTDKAFLNLAKGVTAAKISFRAYTAIKQVLSWPAFLADTNPLILGKNTLPINWKKNWDWAMENLPNFKKRVESRKAGLDILEDTSLDSKFWGTDFAKWINQNGMFMNAFVDALTVSIGARSVYETRKARYLKEGFSEEEADRKAKMDAEVAYNETQQSSEKEFMSTMQAHRTVANVALSAYRNSSMGYQRQLHQALRTLGRMARKGYKSEAIEYMTKQLEREGLSTEDAEKAAINRYERAGWQALVRVAVFGWLVQFAWNLGAHAIYLLFGDDPDEKKNMLVEDATHALIGGPIEGLAAGNIMSEAFNMIKNGENLRNWDPTTLPIMSDIKSTISKMSSDPVAGANDLVYLAAQIGLGTNPQTISDAIVAIVDACNGDFETAREVMFCIMRILAVPQSQLDQLMIDEIGMSAKDARELSYEDVAKRYVDYKMKRNAPVTGPLYSDELREKREKSLNTTFKKKVNERKKLKEEE